MFSNKKSQIDKIKLTKIERKKLISKNKIKRIKKFNFYKKTIYLNLNNLKIILQNKYIKGLNSRINS